jgi:hypothetical protein
MIDPMSSIQKADLRYSHFQFTHLFTDLDRLLLHMRSTIPGLANPVFERRRPLEYWVKPTCYSRGDVLSNSGFARPGNRGPRGLSDNPNGTLLPVPSFRSCKTISRTIPRVSDCDDPRISINSQFHEAIPQPYKSRTKRSAMMPENRQFPIRSITPSN